MFDIMEILKSGENRRAWLIAIAADVIQIAALPAFIGGVLSPADDVLDVIVGTILVRLLGWHWAFLPSFVAKLMPGFDLFPTWTAAVLFVTSRRTTIEPAAQRPTILFPGPNRTLPR